MPYRANYPATVAEVLDDNAKFKPDALRVVKALARSKPWQGPLHIREIKLRQCLAALSLVYGIEEPRLVVSQRDCYILHEHAISLSPQLSVVTFLHEFALARGMDERQACRWSINLFRRCFPRSFERLVPQGHMLVRP